MTKPKVAAPTPIVPKPMEHKNILAEREDAAQNFIGAQQRGDNWKPLPNTRPVQFMDLRNGMCRWPIGDPHHLESFRFCGVACSTEATYCDTHKAMAISPARNRGAAPERPVATMARRVA
jgi:GcrA cell cycle regulator